MLETGKVDHAWSLQIEPEILEQMEAAGNGKVVVSFQTSVERQHLNQPNPDPALGAEMRSVFADGTNPHPFLSDPMVGKALSMAIDRNLLVEAGYSKTGQATCNELPAPPLYASTANDDCKVQDMQAAKALLDEASWAMGGDGVRAKYGVRLSVLYQTSTNSVRQGTQALIKQWWNELGVEVELRNIDASVFFGGDTFQKFHPDIEMYTNNLSGADPEA